MGLPPHTPGLRPPKGPPANTVTKGKRETLLAFYHDLWRTSLSLAPQDHFVFVQGNLELGQKILTEQPLASTLPDQPNPN